jgi:hypothetical protein
MRHTDNPQVYRVVESLESKLDRLTPEQRHEVEDFVDFLIQRSGGLSATVQINPSPSQSVHKPVPPPFIASEPVQPDESRAAGTPGNVLPGEPVSPLSSAESEVSPITEIAIGDGDDLTHEYMDYGQFEQPAPVPSPTDAAVKRVKAKISKRAEEKKSGKLLDWID